MRKLRRREKNTFYTILFVHTHIHIARYIKSATPLYTLRLFFSLSQTLSLQKREVDDLPFLPTCYRSLFSCSLSSFLLSLRRRRRRRFLVLHFFANVPSGAQLWLGILWCGYIGRFSSFLETLKTYAEATNTMPNPTAVFRRQCFGSANHPP